jgi:glycosyltransferase involved in cell wall biosynthesis
LLTENVDSLLFEADNVNDLSKKMEVLIHDSQKRKLFGENGFKKVSETYTWDIVLKKYRQAYEIGIKNFMK